MMLWQRYCRQSRGFSLLESLICLAMIIILTAIALPVLLSLQQSQLTQLTNNLTTAVKTARAQALYYRSTTFICPSATGNRCDNDWNQPHVLVMLAASRTAEARVLYDIPMPHVLGTLTWQGFGSSPYPQMNPSGDSFQYNGTWRYCRQDAQMQEENRTIRLSRTGKVTVTSGDVC